jgi:hypothetical protein
MPEESKKEERKEEPPEKKEEAPPPKKEEKKGDFNPSPDHPRFKEVYFKMKDHERELREREKDVEALRAHSEQLAAALQEIKESKKAEEPEPDPVVDPEAYKAWHRHQIAKKDKEYQLQREKDRVASLIEIESGLHEDYDKAVKIAEREMARDPALKKKVWGSANPARAAYQLGRKSMDEAAQKEKDEQERQERLDAGDVHKDNPPPPKTPDPDEGLSAEEKRVIRNLFPQMEFKEAAKKYAEHKKLIGAGR